MEDLVSFVFIDFTYKNSSLSPLSLSLYLHQDMRSPRFAYKKEDASQPEIVEVLTKHTFPLSNGLVRRNMGCDLS